MVGESVAITGVMINKDELLGDKGTFPTCLFLSDATFLSMSYHLNIIVFMLKNGTYTTPNITIISCGFF